MNGALKTNWRRNIIEKSYVINMYRRRQWHPTPVLLPGESRGWRSLEGCSPWGCWGSDTTERLHFHALEKEIATHSSVLAWRIPGTGKPGGLPSMGSHRVGHDWSDLAISNQYVLIKLAMIKMQNNMIYNVPRVIWHVPYAQLLFVE